MKVYSTLAGVKLPFPVPNPFACVNRGLNCPLKSGAPVELTMTLPIPSFSPSVKVIVQFILKDQDKNDVFCFNIDGQIEDAYENVEA